jgi:competence protein ComEC
VPLLWPPPDLPPDGAFDLIALDIGQGGSIVVRTRTHELAFDAGPQYSTESNAGQRVVLLLLLLRARSEGRLDKLVLSHPDLDHVGGAATMLKAMPIDELLSSLEHEHPLLVFAAHATRCVAGQSWVWDGGRFEMLRPQAGDYDRVQKSNAMSCVLRVSGAGRSALVGVGIEREQRAALVTSSAETLCSDVPVLPHHGRRTSSTARFIEAVRPRIAVFQAGYRKRFGHPSADVLERYRSRGVQMRLTPDCGAFVRRSSGPVDGLCQRDEARRYSHFIAAEPG